MIRKVSEKEKNEIKRLVSSGLTKKEVARRLVIPYHSVKYYTRGIKYSYSIRVDEDTIKKLRREVSNGKTKKQVAREYNLPYYIVRKHTSDIDNTLVKRLTDDQRKSIHEQYIRGKKKRQIAKEMNISMATVLNYCNGDFRKNNSKELIEVIRNDVRKHRSIVHACNRFKVSYDFAKYCTRDIPKNFFISQNLVEKIRETYKETGSIKKTSQKYNIKKDIIGYHVEDLRKNSEPSFKSINYRISRNLTDEEIKKIRDEVNKTNSISMTCEKFNLPYDTVHKYTRGLLKIKASPDLIYKIRSDIYKTKCIRQTADNLGITYATAYYYAPEGLELKHSRYKTAKDQSPKKKNQKTYSNQMINTIRRKVLNGETKKQVAIDYEIPYYKVIEMTRDIGSIHHASYNGIKGNALKILIELNKRGYVIGSSKYKMKDYYLLKKKFPNIIRIKYRGKTIIFLKERSQEAAKAFLDSFQIRISGYHKLKEILKQFNVELTMKEKKRYIIKK